MEIIIENTRLGKQTKIVVQDDFYTEPEDIIVSFDTERFKLVTTKSEEDKLREKLAIEFGEEVYPKLYEKYPNFGETDCELTKTVLQELLKVKLADPKYEPLMNDKNPDILMSCLVNAYTQYCAVRKSMDKRDEEILSSKKDDNIFFDYIMRFEDLFQTSKTMKDISEGIVKLHEYQSVDPRGIVFGYGLIFKMMKPYFDWVKSVDDELKTMKPYKPVKEQTFYSDEQYIIDHGSSVVKQCIENLNNLLIKYTEYKNEISSRSDTSTPFPEYAKIIINLYDAVVDAKNKLLEQVKLCNEGKENTATVMKEEFSKTYTKFVHDIIDLRIKANIDPRPFESDYYSILDAHFTACDYWINLINGSKDIGKDIETMCTQMSMHKVILQRIVNGELDAGKVIRGEYSQEELLAPSKK